MFLSASFFIWPARSSIEHPLDSILFFQNLFLQLRCFLFLIFFIRKFFLSSPHVPLLCIRSVLFFHKIFSSLRCFVFVFSQINVKPNKKHNTILWTIALLCSFVIWLKTKSILLNFRLLDGPTNQSVRWYLDQFTF